jgi:hypothetical protein
VTTFDWCRHCGNHGPMTEEHLPPRVAGNKSPITVYNEQDGALTVLRSFEGGHTVPSLCAADNNKASDRGLPQAYALWRDDTIGHLQEAAAAFHQVTGQPHNDMFFATRESGAFILPMEHGTKLGSAHIVNLNPGKIVRHVLGMMLAVQGARYLLDTQPQLAAAYLSDEPASIEPFALHVTLADGGLGYFRDAVLSVSIDLTGDGESRTTEFWAVAFAPFLILLTNGPKAPIEATRIDQWLDYPVGLAFNKRDRKVRYPIADPRELLVSKLYQGQQTLQLYPAAPTGSGW